MERIGLAASKMAKGNFVLYNFFVILLAFLLYKYRGGDSNRRSVWICSRNDAIANIAVIFAGLGVWYTNTRWPDLAVAIIIASLALSGSFQIIRQAKRELKN